MSALFADSFYFLALANPRDNAHSKCLEFSQKSDRPIITTSWVLMEVGDALCRGSDRAVFSLLLDELARDDLTTVLPVTQDSFQRAVSLFVARPDKEWSLTDCTSFLVMEQHGLREALTADRHFQQAGFIALLSD
jgi:predicted nucleic acid-binding protein